MKKSINSILNKNYFSSKSIMSDEKIFKSDVFLKEPLFFFYNLKWFKKYQKWFKVVLLKIGLTVVIPMDYKKSVDMLGGVVEVPPSLCQYP